MALCDRFVVVTDRKPDLFHAMVSLEKAVL